MANKTQEIINKKLLNLVGIEEENRKVVNTLGEAATKKLNALVKNPPNFKKKKPKKDFVRPKIYRRPRLNFF